MVWSHTDFLFNPERFKSKGYDGYVPTLSFQNVLDLFYRIPTYTIAPGFFFLSGLLLGRHLSLGKVYSNEFFLKKSLYCLFFAFLLNALGFGGRLIFFEVLYCFSFLFLAMIFLKDLSSKILGIICALCFLVTNFITATPEAGFKVLFLKLFVTGGRVFSFFNIDFPLLGWLGVFLVGLLWGQSEIVQRVSGLKKILVFTFSSLVLFFLLRIENFKTLAFANDSLNLWRIFIVNKIPPKLDYLALGSFFVALLFLGGELLSENKKIQNFISKSLYVDSLKWYVVHILILLGLRFALQSHADNSFATLFAIFTVTSICTFLISKYSVDMTLPFIGKRK